MTSPARRTATTAWARRARGPRAALAAAAASVVAVAGCSVVASGQVSGTAGTVATAATSGASLTRPSPSAAPRSPAASPATPHLSPPRVAGISWRPSGTLVHGHPVTYVALTDGSAVALMWIDPTLASFRLVPGYQVPEGGPALAADNKPSTWVPKMVAAFNGGFRLKDHVGGYYYARRMVAPLVPGLGALEITADGRLHVGQWGRDLRLTAQTVAVRENLPLLVDGFRARTSANDTPSTWGIANGGLWTANRSALGQRPDGSLVYAYGYNVPPATMAAALVDVGVRTAMVLDMNKSWPGGFFYWRTPSGTVGRRIQSQEWHVPSVYYTRFTKDFVAVLSR
jgi:hypothetical protein